jgi:hypothetical protein
MTQRGQDYAFEEAGTRAREQDLDYRERDLKTAIAAEAMANDPGEKAQAKLLVDKRRLALLRQEVVLLPDGSIDRPQSQIPQSRVVYDWDPAVRDQTRVRLHGGLFFTDDAHTKILDTARLVTHFSGIGKGIYVMSREGNLHVISHKVGLRHHTSPLAGANVACAGELQVMAGKLTWLSNKSGHYAPQIEHLAQVLHRLKKAGCAMDFELMVYTCDPLMKDRLGIKDQPQRIGKGTITVTRRKYDKAQVFLDQLFANDVDYELLKLLAYVHHFGDQKTNLEKAGWRWQKPFSPEKPGFYEIATGKAVPHSEVRQWFKRRNLLANEILQRGTGTYQ